MASMLRAAWMAFVFAADVMMLLVSMTAAATMACRTFVVTIPIALATSLMSY
jgi:hypothetical protein